jgi:DNA repair protein SbcD/Mre11
LAEVDRGQTKLEFCPLSVRAFRTIRVDVSQADDPQTVLLRAIAAESLQEAVIRLIYQVRSEQLDQIDSTALHQALSTAHTYTIHAELVSQLARPRLPEMGTGSHIDPMEALKTYITNQPQLSDIAIDMMEAAQTLLTHHADSDFFAEPDWQEWQQNLDFTESAETASEPSQLRLL